MSEVTDPSGKVSRYIVTIAAIVILIAGLKAAAPIVNFFLIALFVSIIAATPTFWLQRKGVPLSIGLSLVIAAIFLLIGVLTTALVNSLSDFSVGLPEYQARLEQRLDPMLQWLDQKDVEISSPSLFPELNPQNILGLVTQLLGNIGSILSNVLLILFAAVFMLIDATGFRSQLLAIADDPQASGLRYTRFTSSVRHYLAIKTWISLATGVGVALSVNAFGLDFPIIWGILAFLLNYIPNVGSIIAAVPAVLLALVQLGISSALIIASGYLLINFVVAYLLEPRIMGRGIGLTASVVYLSLIFWGWVLGPVGMILAVPLTMTLKLALESDPSTRRFAALLSTEAPHDN